MTRILVVDDEKSVVEFMEAMLKGNGYDVSVAYDGKEALATAKRDNPDLIVLDIMMPEMDGITVSGILFQDPVMRLIPVLILTAKAGGQNMFELAPNIRLYMQKPFDPPVLLANIEKLLQSRQGTIR